MKKSIIIIVILLSGWFLFFYQKDNSEKYYSKMYSTLRELAALYNNLSEHHYFFLEKCEQDNRINIYLAKENKTLMCYDINSVEMKKYIIQNGVNYQEFIRLHQLLLNAKALSLSKSFYGKGRFTTVIGYDNGHFGKQKQILFPYFYGDSLILPTKSKKLDSAVYANLGKSPFE
ncbi:MAG: hypothetical protein QM768_16570 [Agriterribacter sp.]